MCGFSACILLPEASINGHNSCTECAKTPSNQETERDLGVAKELAADLQASLQQITHRGPDDTGIWISANEQVGLAHCRLSINDLSSAGRQPLHSSDNRIHAVVNGEIYDYDRLRHECETRHHYPFQSDSDSELVLALYSIHGAPDFLTHLRGEFAFVLYDARHGAARVIAARDRYGIKPLVYTRLGSKLLVASEAKAFLPLGWKPRWDVRAIADAGWMCDDRTLFRGVRKLLPGHYLDIAEQGDVRQVKYWDAEYEDKVWSIGDYNTRPTADVPLHRANPKLVPWMKWYLVFARGWSSPFVFAFVLMSPSASTYLEASTLLPLPV